MSQTILIVEDKESMSLMLKEALSKEGFRVLCARSAEEAADILKGQRPDLVLTDLKLPGKDGMSMLSTVKDATPLTPVVIMTAYGSIETAVRAIKEGAFDFITKPFDIDHLIMLINRAIENQRLLTENILLKEEFSGRFGLPAIIGKSEKIKEVARSVQKVAPTKTTVFLTGESGTGKELFARAIHYLSPRKGYPFVPINCAAIPQGLLEAELFGFEKGAFTGAESRKIGKFELAQNGTIFLDEIGELEQSLQAKLLRVIEEGEIERIGGTKTIKIDVRIVAATNRDIEAEVSKKRFREDLYYRLNVFPINIPPLRERKEDIPLLAEYFLKKYSKEIKTEVKNISSEAIDMLLRYNWKGNVRELENTIERAIILCEGKEITPEHLSLNIHQFRCISASGSLEEVSKEAQREAETIKIRQALEEAKGNKTRAAEALKVSYKTLLTKIKEYGIE